MDVNDQENNFLIKNENHNNHYNQQIHDDSNNDDEENFDDEEDDLETDAQNNNHHNNISDNNLVPPDNVPNDAQIDNNHHVDDDDVNMDKLEDEFVDQEFENDNEPTALTTGPQPPAAHALNDLSIWTLPANKDVCTLDEIRRGQFINKVAPNECPVLGCGKKINENRLEPSPGTISSGLRTHVLFVHYANRKIVKKRKLGWSTKRRNQTSPRKQVDPLPAHSSPSVRLKQEHGDLNDNHHTSNLLSNLQKNMAAALAPQVGSSPGSLLDRKVKQMAANKSLQVLQMSSHQSLMQATGGVGGASGGNKPSPQPAQRQKNLTTTNSTSLPPPQNNNFNPTTSSLFSILAGLTQQQKQHQLNQTQQQPAVSRNIKTAHGTNTINISQCSRNSISNNNNRAMNSSLLSLLNEKISGNVASSLQTQLKKSLVAEQRNKNSSSTTRQQQSISSSPATATNSSFYHLNNNNNNEPNFNNAGSSILSTLCGSGIGGDESGLSYDTSMPMNTFVESIAIKTGSNVGPGGVSEVKRIIEKFTTSLISSAQTIADHYLAPYGGDVPQQKPEISPSDVILAYKMMHKSHGQS